VPPTSARAASFTESVIREMTRLALEHDAVNLAQGFPDFACPPELKQAAKAAIDADVNQYAITWGARRFRHAVAAKVAATYPGWTVDPERELTVTCGSTEAMIASLFALTSGYRMAETIFAGQEPASSCSIAAASLPHSATGRRRET
jgi:aspartate/methionine/tyrosine aminotransferase